MWSLSHEKDLCLILSFLCLPLLFGGVTRAADWSFTPGIKASEEYNDNVLFTKKDTLEDFVTSIRPNMQLLGKTEETQLRLDSTIIYENYKRYGHLNTIDTDNKLSLDHQWSPKFLTTLTGTFKKDKILETELQRAGQVRTRGTRYRHGFDLSGTYALSDVLSLTVDGGMTFSRYRKGMYPDLDLWQVNVNPVWAINPRDKVGLFINYYDADYKGTSTIKTSTNSLYWRRDLSDTTYFVLGAGYRFTWTRYGVQNIRLSLNPDICPECPLIYKLVKEEKTGEDSGFIFNFELNNDWTERFSTVVNAGKEHYDAVDARGIDRKYIRMTLKYRLSEKISSNCQFGYDRTSEESSTGVDTDYLRIAPYLSWKISENLSLKLGGSYEYSQEKIKSGGYGRDRFRGWITVSYKYPRLLANH